MRGALQWTPRRQQVLRLIQSGKGPRDIAPELGVTWRTARKHVEHVLELAGARSMEDVRRSQC